MTTRITLAWVVIALGALAVSLWEYRPMGIADAAVYVNDVAHADSADVAATAHALSGGAGAGTVTSVAMTVPSLLSVTGSPITTSGTLALSYSGTALPIANGGTGLTATPTNGQLDIGNGTGFTRAALTAGTGMTVTNGAGSITIAQNVNTRPDTMRFVPCANTWRADGATLQGVSSNYRETWSFTDNTAGRDAFITIELPYSCGGRTNVKVTYTCSAAGSAGGDHSMIFKAAGVGLNEVVVEANMTSSGVVNVTVGGQNNLWFNTSVVFAGIMSSGDTQLVLRMEEANNADSGTDATWISGTLVEIY